MEHYLPPPRDIFFVPPVFLFSSRTYSKQYIHTLRSTIALACILDRHGENNQHKQQFIYPFHPHYKKIQFHFEVQPVGAAVLTPLWPVYSELNSEKCRDTSLPGRACNSTSILMLLIATYRAVYDSVHHTPLGRFSMVDISMVGIVSVPKRIGVGNVSPRAFRRRVVRYWNRAWKTAPRGCDTPRRVRYIPLPCTSGASRTTAARANELNCSAVTCFGIIPSS